ncbi:MAG TPA: CBS domain-containing protein [Acidimicrobiales bacterium]|jgi:CBS-domain-containing membrane protein|nr:CBS domain-containing protein [Acidimicrobiales bacterium]
MSPRAAWRLERLGFASVSDYEAGKMDWLSYGLPRGGSALLAGDVVDRSVATCDLDAPLGEARTRANDHGDGLCVVVADGDVVMGIVGGEALEGPAERRAEQAMTFGVSTVRPSEDVEALVERMSRAGVDAILVTSSDARLLGVLRRAEAESAARHRSPIARGGAASEG